MPNLRLHHDDSVPTESETIPFPVDAIRGGSSGQGCTDPDGVIRDVEQTLEEVQQRLSSLRDLVDPMRFDPDDDLPRAA